MKLSDFSYPSILDAIAPFSATGRSESASFLIWYLVNIDLKEPWTTHRKYQVFDEKYVDIFGRPEVTSARIIFCHELIGQIQNRVGTLKNQLVGKYVLTQFFYFTSCGAYLKLTRLVEN